MSVGYRLTTGKVTVYALAIANICPHDFINIRTYAKWAFMPKLRGYSRRKRNELRYYEPKIARKRVNCVSPKYQD